jgi:hypothetical protein
LSEIQFEVDKSKTEEAKRGEKSAMWPNIGPNIGIYSSILQVIMQGLEPGSKFKLNPKIYEFVIKI